MSPNVGFATLSVIPSLSGFKQELSKQVDGPLADVSGKAGKSSGTSFLSGFGSVAKAGAIGAGVAIGALVAKGLGDGLEQGKANDKLAAQLGASGQYAEDLGRIAGNLYADAYGDSIGEVNEALRGVMQSGIIPEDATNAQIEAVTAKVLDLSTAFDQDLAGASAAAGTLIRTGLAKDADEALDIITRGFQQGADKQGDFLDTLTEYPSVLRDLGLSGAEATGLLSQGLSTGARNADVVADALKEFAIRGQDASESSAAGFEALGLNAEKMTAAIAAGGDSASWALDEVLDRLRSTEDPVERNAAAVALFGTKAEDLGDSLFGLDLDTAAKGLGDIGGAAERMGDTLNDNAATKIEAFKRGAMQGLTNFIGREVIPAAERFGETFQQDLLPKIQEFGDWLSANVLPVLQDLGRFVMDEVVPAVAEFWQQLAKDLQPALEALWELFSTKVLPVVQFLAEVLVTRIIPILGEVAGFILRNVIPALAQIITKITEVATWVGIKVGEIVGFVLGIPARIADTVSTMWDGITSGISGAKDWVRDRINDIVGFVSGMPARIRGAAAYLWDGIKDAFKAAINWVIRAWNSLEFTLPELDLGPLGKVGGWTVGTPEIDEFHTGGLFEPAGGGREGLALLLRGERVLSPAETREYDAGRAGGRGPLVAGDVTLQLLPEEDPMARFTRELERIALKHA